MTDINPLSTQSLADVTNTISSMRWAFVTTVKVSLIIAVVSVVGLIVAACFGKTVDLAGVVALEGVLLTTAFGGKALQSGQEKVTPAVSTTVTDTPTVAPVTTSTGIPQ